MSEKSVIIIGAGLAGLGAGIYGRLNGYATTILEHHSLPGGVVAAWKRKGYTIDGGIHWLMGWKEGSGLDELYRQMGILPDLPVVELKHYARYVHQPGGEVVDVTQDLDRFGDDLKKLSPTDAPLIDQLIAGAHSMRSMSMQDLGMSKPPELAGAWDAVRTMWRMRHSLKYFGGKFGGSMADYTAQAENGVVAHVLNNLFLREVSVWFNMMLLAMIANGQLGLMPAGSLKFSLAIAKRYKALGGEIKYNQTVEKILVEKGRAVGVRMSDGEELRADTVISAADGYSTIFKMLDGQFTDRVIDRRYKEWPLIRPTVMVNLGVAKSYKELPHLMFIHLDKPIQVGDQAIADLMVRLFNYSDRLAPEGHQVIQATFECEFDYWNELQEKDRAAYDAEKERVAAEVLERLAAYYPEIGDHVEMTNVATPYTTWRYTRNRQGAYEGWLPTPEILMTKIPRTLPGLKNFYMAGQWVLPGGGVPTCLLSGGHAIQLMCKRDGKKWIDRS